MSPQPGREEIRIGISSCLLGHKVRYDGGHKKDPLVTGALSSFMTFVPVCSEVEVGMSVPRPPIRLVRWRLPLREDRFQPLLHLRRCRLDRGIEVRDDVARWIDQEFVEVEGDPGRQERPKRPSPRRFCQEGPARQVPN